MRNSNSMARKQIHAIRVLKLFGLYTYELPESGSLCDAAILYGDNGVGKSTLLRLVYHLLSGADGRGHRNALYQGEFERLEVVLASGVKVVAERSKEEDFLVLKQKIEKADNVLVSWDFYPSSQRLHYLEDEEFIIHVDQAGERRIVRRPVGKKKSIGLIPQGKEAFLSELRNHTPATFILNAERRLDSDMVPDPSDEVELRKFMHYETSGKINELVMRSREIALSQALSAASKWLSKKAIIGTNQGSMNVHSVYVDVLHHVMSPAGGKNDQAAMISLSRLEEKLKHIEDKMKEHAQYELATKLSTAEFREALRSRGEDKGALAAGLLRPYIESLEKRLEAVEPIYKIVDTFVTTVNGFLRDKVLRYTLSQGFGIWNRLGIQLSPSQLSSGEQQLLLLFCYVLTARDEPSVFMIDEPEISLNVKWQRQLVRSLLLITNNSSIQFVFASHSIELLSQHEDRVVQLVSR